MSRPKNSKPQLRAVQTRRIYEQIADQFLEIISSKQMLPGERLPSERDLAVQFGVSRPSVREAMIALEAAGAVQIRPGEGVFVTEISKPVRQLQLALPSGWREQLDAGSLIEPHVAAQAALNATEEECATLELLVAHMSAPERTPDERLTDRRLFHITLAQAARNDFLAECVRHLWDLRVGAMWSGIKNRQMSEQDHAHDCDDRAAIAAAVRSHNPKAAEDSMKAFYARIIQRYYND